MLTSMEYIFYYFYFLNVWVMMSMGEGIAKIKGPMMRWYPS